MGSYENKHGYAITHLLLLALLLRCHWLLTHVALQKAAYQVNKPHYCQQDLQLLGGIFAQLQSHLDHGQALCAQPQYQILSLRDRHTLQVHQNHKKDERKTITLNRYLGKNLNYGSALYPHGPSRF